MLKFALDELGLSPHRSAKDGRCVPGVVTATFTGKAALVLTRKGTPARTIHSLIYTVIEATEEEIEEAARKIALAERDALRLTGFARTSADAAIEAMRQPRRRPCAHARTTPPRSRGWSTGPCRSRVRLPRPICAPAACRIPARPTCCSIPICRISTTAAAGPA